MAAAQARLTTCRMAAAQAGGAAEYPLLGEHHKLFGRGPHRKSQRFHV